MSRIIRKVFFTVAALHLCVGCGNSSVFAHGGNFSLSKGESLFLFRKDSGPLVWKSSDESVAKVENGVVFAKKEGSCRIFAKTVNNFVQIRLFHGYTLRRTSSQRMAFNMMGMSYVEPSMPYSSNIMAFGSGGWTTGSRSSALNTETPAMALSVASAAFFCFGGVVDAPRSNSGVERLFAAFFAMTGNPRISSRIYAHMQIYAKTFKKAIADVKKNFAFF